MAGVPAASPTGGPQLSRHLPVHYLTGARCGGWRLRQWRRGRRHAITRATISIIVVVVEASRRPDVAIVVWELFSFWSNIKKMNTIQANTIATQSQQTQSNTANPRPASGVHEQTKTFTNLTIFTKASTALLLLLLLLLASCGAVIDGVVVAGGCVHTEPHAGCESVSCCPNLGAVAQEQRAGGSSAWGTKIETTAHHLEPNNKHDNQKVEYTRVVKTLVIIILSKKRFACRQGYEILIINKCIFKSNGVAVHIIVAHLHQVYPRCSIIWTTIRPSISFSEPL